ncbi:MAG: TetR/AcrR family transcriptional regulator [Sarcina sp.]
MKKGYDNTTIQDIVDELGDLSKGAIYHHFKSKEDIMEAVIPRIYKNDDADFLEDKNHNDKNALEKLKRVLLETLKNPGQEKLVKAAPNLMKNPRILTRQLFDGIETIVPQMIEPIVREGMKDGSIKTENPKELAESFIILTNTWLNPSVFWVDKDTFRRKFEFLRDLLIGLGMPVLDENFFEVMEMYRVIIENSRK